MVEKQLEPFTGFNWYYDSVVLNSIQLQPRSSSSILAIAEFNVHPDTHCAGWKHDSQKTEQTTK